MQFISYGVIFLMVLITGCATNVVQGQQFNDRSVKNIKVGKTTRSEVAQMFGQAQNRQSTGGGNEAWMYNYSQFNSEPTPGSYIPIVNMFATGANSQAIYQTLRVEFKGDVVSTCTYYKSNQNISGSVGIGGFNQSPGQGSSVSIPCNEAQ